MDSGSVMPVSVVERQEMRGEKKRNEEKSRDEHIAYRVIYAPTLKHTYLSLSLSLSLFIFVYLLIYKSCYSFIFVIMYSIILIFILFIYFYMRISTLNFKILKLKWYNKKINNYRSFRSFRRIWWLWLNTKYSLKRW